MRARRVSILAAALSALVVAAVATPAGEDDLQIPRVETSFAGHDLRVDARLSPGLPPDVLKRLVSGLPTTAIWEVRLLVSRDPWWDGFKDERRYAMTATYRPDSGDYALERRLDGRLLETLVVPGREDAVKALSVLPALPCFTMGKHFNGKPLYVKVRCLYGTEMALGVVPTRTATAWRRSPIFVWNEGEGVP